MDKFYRVAAVIASIWLIIWDVNVITTLLGGVAGAENGVKFAIDSAFLFMIPCNLFLGVSVLLHLSGKKAAVPLFIATMIVTGIHFLLRILTIGWYLVDMANGLTANNSSEYLDFAQFVGYALLIGAIFLFSLYGIKNILKKTTTALFALAAVILIVTWIITFSSNLSVFGTVNFGNIGEFLSLTIAGDTIAAWVGFLGYAIIFIQGLKIAE